MKLVVLQDKYEQSCIIFIQLIFLIHRANKQSPNIYTTFSLCVHVVIYFNLTVVCGSLKTLINLFCAICGVYTIFKKL